MLSLRSRGVRGERRYGLIHVEGAPLRLICVHILEVGGGEHGDVVLLGYTPYGARHFLDIARQPKQRETAAYI